MILQVPYENSFVLLVYYYIHNLDEAFSFKGYTCTSKVTELYIKKKHNSPNKQWKCKLGWVTYYQQETKWLALDYRVTSLKIANCWTFIIYLFVEKEFLRCLA